MKKREKDAIRNLTNKVELWKKKRPEYGNSDIVYEIDEENKQINILLCLVKSQQLEITELKELIKLYKDISVDKDKIREKMKEYSQIIDDCVEILDRTGNEFLQLKKNRYVNYYNCLKELLEE